MDFLFLLFFTLCFFTSFAINWLMLRFSRGLGVRNNNEFKQERWSSEVKPAVGGISFYIVFLIGAVIAALFTFDANQPASFNQKLIGVLGACTLGFLLGLADDTYNTNPLVKFIGQLSCAFILIVSNVSITSTGLESVDFILTVLWVIGLMNSINMLDNMDGITASISASIILSVIGFSLVNSNWNSMHLVLLAVLGSLIGFLIFNWKPAKMYMGDTGSQFLGVFLAAISMWFIWGEKNTTSGIIQIKQFLIPALVFLMPLVDTATVTIRRLARRQSPFVGGKDHTTHHLVYAGLNEKMTAIVFLLLSLLSGGFAIAYKAALIPNTFSFTLLGVIYCLSVFFLFQVIYNIGIRKQEAKEE